MFFTEEREMLRQAVRDFAAQEIRLKAAEWDADDKFPRNLFPIMGEIGITGVIAPESLGGAGLGYVDRAMCIEEISRYSGGLGIAVMTHHLGMSAILDAGTKEQKEKYIPDLASGKKIGGLSVTEAGGGSDFMGQKSRAEKCDNGWVLNGRKCFITNAGEADVDVWTVHTGEDAKGRPALTAFIMDETTVGHRSGRKENKIGLRGSVTGDVICENVCLGDDAVLGAVGGGAKVGMHAIGEVGRSGMAAICVGILRACLEESIKFANERIIYGKPLARLQSAQFAIAENRTAYEAARLMLYNAMELKDNGEPCGSEVAMAKLFSTEEAVKAAKRTIDLMGGYGCINEYPVGRYLRDAMASIPSGGTSHIQKLVITGGAMKEIF
ncbi:MAG: acyl-CoA dehydrogenase family protein [Synergistes jonesii]|uniref:acyl-CoA dehydrogenase family protein n=1 Tax=Synergistes jonesii TaxID=2754 RepID=UPI002A755A7B|nr:acyl-CoA dehydrogenase family protein [Synergistes jonesii]MDY2985586.1 acyl-CoA dehydrogenase family protein [Synergistes jonesii]